MAETYKLCYFDSRGFAEVTRLQFALKEQKFEDCRWTREEWGPDSKYKKEAPFGQGPYLIYTNNGETVKIGQSHAIACFVGRQLGLYGKTNLDAAVIDQVIGLYKDLIAVWMKLRSQAPDDKDKQEEMKKKLKEEDFPKIFGDFVKLINANPAKSGYFVQNEISVADIYIYDLVYQLKVQDTFDAASKFPEIKTLYDNVDSNPKIAAYVKTRKQTEM